MTILVTGASGFIGKSLVKRLSCTHDVFAASREDTGDGQEVGGCQYVKINWDDPKSLDRIAKGAETVFHLAALICGRFSWEFYKVNVTNTVRLFEACLRQGVKRFVYLSSILAAGPTRQASVLDETTTPCPSGLYGRSKLIAERRLGELGREADIELYTIRSPMVYGAGQNALFSRFFRMALSGGAIVFGNGKNLRSFCYLENLLDALEQIATMPRGSGGLYYIADKEICSTEEFANLIARIGCAPIAIRRIQSIFASTGNFLYSTLANLGIHSVGLSAIKSLSSHLACRIDKAERALSYKPRFSLEEGLRKTIEWLKQGAKCYRSRISPRDAARQDE